MLSFEYSNSNVHRKKSNFEAPLPFSGKDLIESLENSKYFSVFLIDVISWQHASKLPNLQKDNVGKRHT